jgi:hypothetical protein
MSMPAISDVNRRQQVGLSTTPPHPGTRPAGHPGTGCVRDGKHYMEGDVMDYRSFGFFCEQSVCNANGDIVRDQNCVMTTVTPCTYKGTVYDFGEGIVEEHTGGNSHIYIYIYFFIRL